MSSEVVEPPPAQIIPAKSEDKLEIEKEEAAEKETSQKVEDDCKEGDNKEQDNKDEKKDEAEKKDDEGKGDEAKQATDSAEAESANKDEAAEGEYAAGSSKAADKKKFTLPKVNIKTPKVISDIRAKSKERKKKKDQSAAEGDKTEGEEDADKTESDDKEKPADASEDKPEGEEATEGAGEPAESSTSAAKEAKAKVKEALDNIKLPKMHRPAFLKKNKEDKSADKADKEKEGEEEKKEEAKEGEEKEGEKATTDEADNKTKEEGEEKASEEKTDGDNTEKKDDEEKKDGEGEEKENEKTASTDKLKESIEETKKSLATTLKNLNLRKNKLFGGKKKDGEGGSGGDEGGEGKEAADEKEKLLDNPENKEEGEGDEEEGGAVKEVKEAKHVKLIRHLRHAASGVPLMFKDIEMQEEDIELGQDLLDKGDSDKDKDKDVEAGDDKDETKEKLQEINIEDNKEEEKGEDKEDKKSVTSEKKDLPEKEAEASGGDGDKDPELGGKAPQTKCKKNKCHVFHQRFKSLDDQQKMGVVGSLVGVFLFFVLIIAIIAGAASPSGWADHHRYVEGGKYISANTGCGEIWGHVDGDHMFSFRGIPYSIQVGRFDKSESLNRLDDCGDEIKKTANKTTFCARRNFREEIIGVEDCLNLDIFTPTIMYNAAQPVVVYLPGDDLDTLPTSQLAREMGVVFVVVHVRQGILGFLSHSSLSDAYPKTSGNFALGDLLTALQWINTNIAHFGGDKEAVTVLGHRQGASLATVLTGMRSADGLYQRVWATGGAARFSNNSLDDSTDLWTKLIQETCPGQQGAGVKDCLLDVELDTLLRAVDTNWEVWSPTYGQVPKAGAEEPQGLLTIDTVMLEKPLDATWKADGIAVPIILGSNQQGEAQEDSYQYLNWENNDVYMEHIEGTLGSWNIQLPGNVLERYNTSNNWVDYMTMVSDIRTICPMSKLASTLSVPMYVATSPRDNGEMGQLADKSADLVAIFASNDDDIQPFQEKLRGMFYEYARTGASFDGIRLVSDEEMETVDSLDNCDFWQEAEPEIIPSYGKIF